MIILNCSSIGLSYGTEVIIENINFNIQENDKTALVGVNGAGKSTLFKIIAGVLHPDSGDIFSMRGLKIGYMEQNSGLDTNNTIWNEIISTFDSLIQMEKRIKELENSISLEKDDKKLETLLKEYASVSDAFSSNGGFEYQSRAKGVLKGLGFSENEFTLCINTLSGGQKTRLALAKLLLEEPDLLMLDEPTNHLDINAIEWLEDFLRNYKKAVFVISHDRYFLDKVTNRTIEIENKKCKTYECNYTEYLKRKDLDREIQAKHYEQQQKEIARMEAFIEQQRQWNREKNIIAAESRQKAIDRMEKIDAPEKLPDKIKMHFDINHTSGNDVLIVEKLAKSYSTKHLFDDVNFKIRKGEKVFLLGPNGCGKSTLLKIINGRLQKDSGEVKIGYNVEIGYYDQEQTDLDVKNSILDELWTANPKLTQTEARSALAAFLFTGEDVFKPIDILSGGEKGRVSLAKLMVSGSNFLLLDEPTNHLDINSREILEEALMEYEGTIFAVSHDRYFIDKIATRIIEMAEDEIVDIDGNYTYYNNHKEKYRQEEALKEKLIENSSEAKKGFIASKEEKAKQRKLERQLKDTEAAIEKTENRISEIKDLMHDEEIAADHVRLSELLQEQSSLESKLTELYETWESVTTELG